jgi:predicted porin
MQKKIIALAVAAVASGAAFAQSNVTVSGQLKLHIDQVSANGCQGAACTNATARTRLTQNTSNVMFSGSEDLGNGLKALFQIDSEVGADQGTPVIGNGDGRLGSRETYVGLAGNWGAFIMGRANAHYTDMSRIDGNGFDGMALNTNSINMFGAVAAAGKAVLGGRADNVMAYLSPNMNGFTVKAAYSAMSESTTPLLAGKDRAWNLALKFDNGPINAAYSLFQVKSLGATAGTLAGATGSPGVDATSHRFGVAYTFPMGLKVGMIWDRSEAEATGTPLSDSKRTAWTLPISYAMGAHKFMFTYGRAGNLTGSANAAADTAGANDTAFRQTTVGYSYDLSKRTQLNASWVTLQNGRNGSQDFWTRGMTAGSVAAGADPTSLSLGIRHAF